MPALITNLVKNWPKAIAHLASFDLLIEVIDARAPQASTQVLGKKILELKNVLQIGYFSFTDFTSNANLTNWQQFWKRKKVFFIPVNFFVNQKIGDLIRILITRGLLTLDDDKVIKIAIVGTPNSGKRTLIYKIHQERINFKANNWNLFLDKIMKKNWISKAIVYKKQEYQIKIADTPPVLNPHVLNDQNLQNHLYMLKKIDPPLEALVNFASRTFVQLLKLNRITINKIYGLNITSAQFKQGLSSEEIINFFEIIAVRRGLNPSDENFDLNNIFTLFLQDLAKGFIKPLILEEVGDA